MSKFMKIQGGLQNCSWLKKIKRDVIIKCSTWLLIEVGFSWSKDVPGCQTQAGGVFGWKIYGSLLLCRHHFHICLNTYVGFVGFLFVLSFDSYGLFVCSVEKDVMELREGSLEVSLPLQGHPHKYAASGQQKPYQVQSRPCRPLTFLFEVVLQAGRGISSNVREAERGETWVDEVTMAFTPKGSTKKTPQKYFSVWSLFLLVHFSPSVFHD